MLPASRRINDGSLSTRWEYQGHEADRGATGRRVLEFLAAPRQLMPYPLGGHARKYGHTRMLDQAQRLRDLVNRPRHLHVLVPDTPRWNEVCSAMDTIDDTGAALDAYEQLEPPSTKGGCYLTIYGALQVLYVQQDALKSLASALGHDYDPDPELVRIRRIRNVAVGHPTRTRSGSSSILVQHSLSHRHFELFEYLPNGGLNTSTISIPNLIARQRSLIGTILDSVSQRLVDEELAHRRRFRDAPLLAGFTQLPYAFEKLGEGTRSDSPTPIASWGLKHVRSVLEAFQQGLRDRGLDSYDVFRYDIPPIEDAIRRLEIELGAGGDRALAEILRYYLRQKFRELERLARETDEEYSSDEV